LASNFIGINRGETIGQDGIDVGAATQSTDFELRIDTGKGSTKEDVLLAMDQIRQYIISNGIQSGGTSGTNLPPL
jgi:hypothetical protein